MSNLSSEDRARLLARLTEDTGSAADAEALLPLIQRISKPSPEAPDMSILSRVSQQAVAVLRAKQRHTRLERFQDWYPVLLLKAQLCIVQSEIWIASALVMLLGVLVTLVMNSTRSAGADLPLVVIAPIVAAAGVSFLYGSDVEDALEIEQATPTSPQLILLLRLMLVFTFDFVLGVIGSIVLTMVNPSYSLSALIISWLAPMAFLSALAFLINIIFAETGIGVVTSLFLWTFQVFNRSLAQNGFTSFPVPDMLAANSQVWLLIIAIPLLGCALWLAEHKHWTIRRPQW